MLETKKEQEKLQELGAAIKYGVQRRSEEFAELIRQDHDETNDVEQRASKAFFDAVLNCPPEDLAAYSPYGNRRISYSVRASRASISRMILADLDGYELYASDAGDSEIIEKCRNGVRGLLEEYLRDAAVILSASPELLHSGRDGDILSIGGYDDSGISAYFRLGDVKREIERREQGIWPSRVGIHVSMSRWLAASQIRSQMDMAYCVGCAYELPGDIADLMDRHSSLLDEFHAPELVTDAAEEALEEASSVIELGKKSRFDGRVVEIVSDEELAGVETELVATVLDNVRRIYALGDLTVASYKQMAECAYSIAGWSEMPSIPDL